MQRDQPGAGAGPGARRATIRDVADHAGVSHQTVSRYLRFNGEGVRESVQQRIRAAVSELGYRPNLAARAMRTTHTGQLAVLLPAGSTHSAVEVMTGITQAAQAGGFAVDALTLSGTSEARASKALDLLDSGLFEGILSLTPLRLPAASHTARTRIVEFELYDDEMHGVGPLSDGSPIEEMMERLVELGHRRFLHLAGSFSHESARHRRDAYLAAAERLGAETHQVIECGWRAEQAREAVLALPEDSPITAVVGANDLLAAGAVRGAMARGWRVPDDISVTGFDSHPLAAWLHPSLTSVEIDHEELGRRAVAHWFATVRHDVPAVDATPAMRVVWRESVAAARIP